MKRWSGLSAIFRDIPWAVVGGVATRAYMPERSTQDLDVPVTAADAGLARERLSEAGVPLVGPLAFGGSVWRAPGGWSLDLIEGNVPRAFEGLSEVGHDAQGLPVLALPYCVLMKWEAGRLRHLAAAQQRLGLADEEALSATRAVFARTSPGALDDLEGLITPGKLEMRQGAEESRGGAKGAW